MCDRAGLQARTSDLEGGRTAEQTEQSVCVREHAPEGEKEVGWGLGGGVLGRSRQGSEQSRQKVLFPLLHYLPLPTSPAPSPPHCPSIPTGF